MKDMSIPILSATLATDLVWAAGYLMIGLGLAAWLGVFDPGAIHGPRRLVDRSSLRQAVISLLLGLAVWLFTSQVIVSVWYSISQQPFDRENLPAGLMAMVSIIPGMVAFCTLLAADAMPDRNLAGQLGYAPRLMLSGFLKGLIGFIVIMPLMFVFVWVLQFFYQLIHYEHPAAHQLLEALDHAGPWQRGLMGFGAVIIAPVFEEFLFRGHLQTVLHRWFAGFGQHPPLRQEAAPGFEVLASPDVAAGRPVYSGPLYSGPVLENAQRVASSAPAGPPASRRWAPWAAILASSLAFAAVHGLWTTPAIFVLAFGLGYIYERTGNLWAPIAVHALFNATQTLIYLHMGAG
jgi:membrane protease YdiL (CAAX protease family)